MTIAELIQNLQNLVEDDNNNVEFDTPIYIDGDMLGDIPMESIRVENDYVAVYYN